MRTTTSAIFFILVSAVFWTTSAAKICYQCSGINCQRTSYNKTEQCVNDLDVCVTVFDGSMIQAQGCMQQLAEDLRKKCTHPSGKMGERIASNQCHVCLSDFCNNAGPQDYTCLQCDSEKDATCRSNPAAVIPSQCPISRANNAYCYVKDDGKRTVRGCAVLAQEQKDCLSQSNCFLCSPMDLKACNVADINNDGGNDNGSNGGSGGGDGGNGGGDGGNGGNGGSDGGNGGSDGGNGGSGGGDGGNNNRSSTIVLNIVTLISCLIILALH